MATAKKTTATKAAAAPAKKAAAKKTAAPAKKAAAKKPALEKDQSKALVSYDEMIAKLRAKGEKEVQKEAATGAGGGVLYMATEGKDFHVKTEDDEESFGDSIQCVVAASSFFNAWYDAPYVRGQSSVPACYAVAQDEDDLAPADNAPKPQADTCAECPMNEWDTGPNGTGKACGNRRRLCILLLSDLEEGIIRPMMLNLPPTALKYWGRYVKAVQRQHGMSFAGVVTRFDFDDDNPQPCPLPTMEGLVPEELLASVFNTLEEAEEIVMAPVNTDGYEEPSAKPRGRAGGSKMAGGKGGKPVGKGGARGGSGKPVAKPAAKKAAPKRR